MDKVLVLGGGRVGNFLAGILKPQASALTVIDLVAPQEQYDHLIMSVLDVPSQVPDLLESSTSIVFALPEDIAIAALECFAEVRPRVNVIINTCSVQGPFQVKALHLFPEVASVGVNPMFSPVLDCRGRPVVVCERRQSWAGDALSELMRENGMDVTRLEPAEHDRIMSLCQALPHAAILAMAFVLSRSGCDIDTLHSLAPPPMRAMLSLVARILQNAPETYWDIQKYNSESQKQRDQLSASIDLLSGLSRQKTCEAFAEELTAVRELLGAHVNSYGDACTTFFEVLSRSGRTN